MLLKLTIVLVGFAAAISKPCFTEDKACQLDSSNLLGSFANTASISECKVICEDTSACEYFTYYDDESVPSYYQKCYLFSGCDTMIEFPKAYTGVNGPCTCSLDVEPQDGEMIKELYAETEMDCKDACLQEIGCDFYTFLESALDCKLLKGVLSYDTSSIEGFHTGPGRCTSEDGICTFALLDNNSHVMLLESVDSLVVRSGMLDCKANVSMVLVGHGGLSGGWTSAGGSGFVNHTFANVVPSTALNIYFDATFGGGQVAVYANGNRFHGELILEAQGGEGGQSKGGDGYSGGGYGYVMDGGTDGGDGHCDSNYPESCGKGQQIDIRKLSSPRYMLTPGPGGITNGANVAGGGGGVLVNGEGTAVMDVSFGMGEGYSSRSGWGFAILEIVY